MRSSSKAAFFIILLITAALHATWPSHVACLSSQVNINTANREELRELPYIGDSRADAIIRYRREHGAFDDLNQLLEVTNIGEKSLEAIKPYLTIGTPGQHVPQNQAVASVHKKINTKPGEVIMLPDEKYFDILVDFIRGADHSIDMTMFLFKATSSPKNKPSLLVSELIKASQKGIKIRVTLENSGYEESINKENRNVAKKLNKKGIKVRFDSPHTTNHAKIIVIDKRYCFIGSHNLSHSALTLNHEFSLLIDNRDLAQELVLYIDKIN